MAIKLAEQAVLLVLVPPDDPLQPHVQGPEPDTDVAVPVEQRLVEGAELKLAPLDEPQAPLTGNAPVEQEAVVPVFNPVQDQVQGPDPETEEAVPAVQRLVEGAELKLAPLEDPQAPSRERLAEQEALEPPLVPEQVQE